MEQQESSSLIIQTMNHNLSYMYHLLPPSQKDCQLGRRRYYYLPIYVISCILMIKGTQQVKNTFISTYTKDGIFSCDKSIIFTFAVLAITTSSRILEDDAEVATMMERHEQWMAQYGKGYKSIEEKAKRFAIFQNNVQLIDSSNNDGSRFYKLNINEFADLTNEEFKASRNGFKIPSQTGDLAKMTPFKYQNVVDVPSSVDWRKKGAVTPVKNQGECGSCWAFSVIAATEGITKLTTGKLVSLSEQELVDCDRSGEDQGCEGGYMEDSFEFIIKNNGIAGEASYPYKAIDSTCNKNNESPIAATIKGYEKVPANSEVALLKAVANQPISVSIDASGFDFQFYSSGVFTGQCGTDLDHGVTAVGYGTNGTMKYWLVKNSWGTSWGEEGYIRMQRGVDAKGGICGIAMDASYPTN